MKMDKFITYCLVAVLFFSGYKSYLENSVNAVSLPVAKKVIVIDPGHGGFDPGKTGTNGENEKVINLKISQRLQEYLEQSGSYVILTRETDEALADSKNADLKKRKEIANESEADILVSIHQNSFPKMSAKGAQVFYYNSSAKGKMLAQCIQESICTLADSSNQRQIKANTDYYVLRTSKVPAVIVECGFLSNTEEEKKLNTEEYQEKMAWAIYNGIVDYFEMAEAQENLSENTEILKYYKICTKITLNYYNKCYKNYF